MQNSSGTDGPGPLYPEERRRILELDSEGLRKFLREGKGSAAGNDLAIARLMKLGKWTSNPMYWIALGVGYVVLAVLVIVMLAWFRPFAPKPTANPKEGSPPLASSNVQSPEPARSRTPGASPNGGQVGEKPKSP